MSKQLAVEHHDQAAAHHHHHAAAHHHHQAAYFHKLGQHELAKAHAAVAFEHADLAHRHSTTANGYSQKQRRDDVALNYRVPQPVHWTFDLGIS